MATDRNIRVSIYLTPEEQKTLADNFKIDLPITGQTKLKRFAECMRSSALDKKISFKRTNPIAQEQFAELARLASNLNQIMHSHHLGNTANAKVVSELLNEIRLNLLNINK